MRRNGTKWPNFRHSEWILLSSLTCDKCELCGKLYTSKDHLRHVAYLLVQLLASEKAFFVFGDPNGTISPDLHLPEWKLVLTHPVFLLNKLYNLQAFFFS